MKKCILGFFSILWISALGAAPTKSEDWSAQAPAGVLLEVSTGRIILSWGEEKSIPPASLTKLMTLHLLFSALEENRLSLTQTVRVLPGEGSDTLEPGASRMGLMPGDQTTVNQLLEGLAVASGNDAGLVLARLEAGTMDAFVQKMNKEAQRLGMKATSFVDSFGLSEKSLTTAADMARFCRFYLQRHPQALKYHSLPETSYTTNSRKILKVQNKNTLLGKYPGLDGLKTGHLEESGYHLAATAQRGNLRFLALVLGVQGATTEAGSEKRAQIARKMLDYGFDRYRLMELSLPDLPQVGAWYTEPGKVGLVPRTKPVFLLSSEELGELSARVQAPKEVLGPWKKDRTLGQLIYSLKGKTILTLDLISDRPVEDANLLIKFFHFIGLIFQGLFGGTAPVDLSKPDPVAPGST